MLYYGNCGGGPYDGRPIAHHERKMVVAIDRETGRAVPGLIGPSRAYPHVKMCAYVWQPALSEWRWDDKRDG